MNFKQFLILALLALSASSCANSDADTKQSSFLSENGTPEIQEDLSAGLKGEDADANGIRDDIDQLIAQKFSYEPEVKRAAEQKARALQQLMEATTREEAMRAAEEISRSTSCIFKILPDPVKDYEKSEALSTEIEAWTANTKQRLSKYFQSNELVGGGYFTEPPEPVCD